MERKVRKSYGRLGGRVPGLQIGDRHDLGRRRSYPAANTAARHQPRGLHKVPEEATADARYHAPGSIHGQLARAHSPGRAAVLLRSGHRADQERRLFAAIQPDREHVQQGQGSVQPRSAQLLSEQDRVQL